MEWIRRGGRSISPCESPSYAVFKARELTGWPAQPAASAVACGTRPEGMLPGPRPTLGPLPSFLLQLSPTHVSLRILAGFPHRKGTRLSGFYPLGVAGTKEPGCTSPDHGTGLVFRCKILQLCARVLAGPRSSAVKFCSSVPGPGRPQVICCAHSRGQQPCPQFGPRGRASKASPRAGVLFPASSLACFSCVSWGAL